MSAALDDPTPMPRFFAVIARGAAQTERDLREAQRQTVKWLREKSGLAGDRLAASLWRARRLHSDSIKRERRIVAQAISRAAPPLIPTWTPIATLTKRKPPNRWEPIEGAPLLLTDATRLRDNGLLLMGNRHEGELTLVVVKTPEHPRRP